MSSLMTVAAGMPVHTKARGMLACGSHTEPVETVALYVGCCSEKVMYLLLGGSTSCRLAPQIRPVMLTRRFCVVTGTHSTLTAMSDDASIGDVALVLQL